MSNWCQLDVENLLTVDSAKVRFSIKDIFRIFSQHAVLANWILVITIFRKQVTSLKKLSCYLWYKTLKCGEASYFNKKYQRLGLSQIKKYKGTYKYLLFEKKSEGSVKIIRGDFRSIRTYSLVNYLIRIQQTACRSWCDIRHVV